MATKQRAALVTPPAETAAKSKKAGFTIPKTLAACADLLYSTKQERLALGKQVAELEARESALREHLIDNLPKSDALGVTGKLARATIEDKDIVLMEDWPAFYKYLVKEYAKNPAVFALMQRRRRCG